MTEQTDTHLEPPRQPAFDITAATHPTDILLNVIAAFLGPMFLCASGGDIYFARRAALETVFAYHARSHADLVAIAQIIGCGLAALGSLSISMEDDLSIDMVLRLRGNAVALNRCAEQNRRAVRQAHPDAAMPHYPELYETDGPAEPTSPDPEPHTANATVSPPEPIAPTQANATPPSAGTVTPNPRTDAMWAAAMADVTSESTGSVVHLPPAEPKITSPRAAALSSTASHLLHAPPAPAFRLNKR